MALPWIVCFPEHYSQRGLEYKNHSAGGNRWETNLAIMPTSCRAVLYWWHGMFNRVNSPLHKRRKIQSVLNDSEYRAPSDPLLKQLNWLPLHERVEYKQSQLVGYNANIVWRQPTHCYSSEWVGSIGYMCALFKSVSNISTITTRSNVRGDLYVPRARTNIFKNCIAVNGAHIWYGLDLVIGNPLARSRSRSRSPPLCLCYIY